MSRASSAFSKVQGELEQLVGSIATSNGFELSGRDPNFGKGASVTWTRNRIWRTDELELQFLWTARTGSRGVYASLGTKIIVGGKSIRVDGYSASWIARGSDDELSIRETDARVPAKVADTLRSDIVASIAWLDRTYATPAAALERLRAEDRNGPASGTPAYRAIVSHLERLAGAE
jgi:hypothetical protein